ncbi:hypothetical protein L1887_15274 [Cichorium endivia]|nr:hypothetical protein L1887_15274 [Cichorium endivia]
MEMIKLSKFKLQLQTLIMEVRELREKERASSYQLHNYVQETIQMKEGIIETLISENKALHSEIGMLVVTVKRIQDTMTHMNEEDIVTLPLMPPNQDKNATDKSLANSHHKDSIAVVEEIRDSPSCKDYAPITNPLIENNNVNSCVSQAIRFRMLNYTRRNIMTSE